MKLKIYKNGDRYVTGGAISLTPLGVKPKKEYDISHFTNEEIVKLKKNPKDKKLLKKVKKL